MKNKSIFQGVRELNEFRFIHNNGVWEVYQVNGQSYVLMDIMRYIKKESNICLYKRALRSLTGDMNDI